MYKGITLSNGLVVDVPSVSQIVGQLDKSGPLIPWAVNMAIEHIRDNISNCGSGAHDFDNLLSEAKEAHKIKKEDAAKTGTSIHKEIELYLRHGELPKEKSAAFNAFYDWEKTVNFELVESEKFLVHEKYLYAGTCDILCRLGGQLYILDIKTGKAIYDSFKLQLAGYTGALLEMINEIAKVAVLRLDKETGEYEFKDFSKNIENAMFAFYSLVDFFYAEKKRRLKNNPRVKNIWG